MAATATISEIEIESLRPNNWFLDSRKLERVRKIWRDGNQCLLPPIFVTIIDDELCLIDGHCRAFVALENGTTKIPAVIEKLENLDAPADLYQYFHRQGPGVGIRNIKDLGRRIVDIEDHGRFKNSSRQTLEQITTKG